MWVFAFVAAIFLFAFINGLIHLFKPDKPTIIRCIALTLGLVISNILFDWGVEHIEWFLGISVTMVGLWKWYE
jgi:hypothetical protein